MSVAHRLFPRHWYSICSRHQHFDPACSLCERGGWIVNRWKVERAAKRFRATSEAERLRTGRTP